MAAGGSTQFLVGSLAIAAAGETGLGELSIDLKHACLGDADFNGVVEVDDLLALISGWGGSDPVLDFNNDGMAGIDDLLLVLDRWGCVSN